MAARHAFRIPSSNEDVTPDKLASSNDRLALYLNATGKMRNSVIQERARAIWVRACYGYKPCLTCGALSFHRVHTVDKLCGRLPMLQYDPLIAAWRLPCHGTDKGVPG